MYTKAKLARLGIPRFIDFLVEFHYEFTDYQWHTLNWSVIIH